MKDVVKYFRNKFIHEYIRCITYIHTYITYIVIIKMDRFYEKLVIEYEKIFIKLSNTFQNFYFYFHGEYPSKEVTFVFSIDINTIKYYSKFKKYIDLY